MDNCSIHHARLVKDALHDAGIPVIYLQPYSSDLNPIEEAFNYIKYFLKDNNELLQVVTTLLQSYKQHLTIFLRNNAKDG